MTHKTPISSFNLPIALLNMGHTWSSLFFITILFLRYGKAGPYAFYLIHLLLKKKSIACRCAILDWCPMLSDFETSNRKFVSQTQAAIGIRKYRLISDFMGILKPHIGNSWVRHKQLWRNRKIPIATSQTKFAIISGDAPLSCFTIST